MHKMSGLIFFPKKVNIRFSKMYNTPINMPKCKYTQSQIRLCPPRGPSASTLRNIKCSEMELWPNFLIFSFCTHSASCLTVDCLQKEGTQGRSTEEKGENEKDWGKKREEHIYGKREERRREKRKQQWQDTWHLCFEFLVDYLKT